VVESARISTRRRAARKPRDAYHHGDLRRALVDAALALVAERGPVDWTLREVARRVGVSHNAPYRHFASREALLAAVAEEGFRAFVRIIEEADARAPREAEARLRGCFATYLRFALENPAALRLMFSHELADKSPYPALRQAALAAYAKLREMMVLAQQEGVLRPGDPDTAALATWSMAHGLSMLVLEGQVPAAAEPRKRDALVEQMFEATLRGIGAPRPRRAARAGTSRAPRASAAGTRRSRS